MNNILYKDDLDIRVYTSNLLGSDDTLVLHGGGNTSLKKDGILYVKGSGWDLSSIKREGFAPVKLQSLKELAKLKSLNDSDMLRLQREAMTDKTAPNPSVEAILHAIIPYKFVDHTHADAIVTISNSLKGEELIKKLFPNFLIVPYVMPGFVLAKKVYEMSKDLDWDKTEGIILHHHGIFTFDNDAKKSYNKMTKAVKKAEDFLDKNAKIKLPEIKPIDFDINTLQEIISKEKGCEVRVKVDQSKEALFYSTLEEEKLRRGVLTPEHIIRTKREPLILKKNDDIQKKIDSYKKEYQDYFNRFKKDEIMLNPAPNYTVIEGFGIVTFGKNEKEADIIKDIISHTVKAVLRADRLGGYKSISLKNSFEMEYWELEQAKLKRK